MHESGQIMVDVAGHARARTYPDFKGIVQTWRDRLPNKCETEPRGHRAVGRDAPVTCSGYARRPPLLTHHSVIARLVGRGVLDTRSA